MRMHGCIMGGCVMHPHLKPCHRCMFRPCVVLPVSEESQWGGTRGRTHWAYDSVSKQKKSSDGRRQPMGCGRGSTEWEMVEGWGRRAVVVR